MEDLPARFTDNFERNDHRVRAYAPYGGASQLIGFLLQGRDLCEQWSARSLRRVLSADEFRRLVWTCIAQSIAQAFKDRGTASFRTKNDAVILYLQNKSMRIISSDLNGLSILIEHYLGDLCHFAFDDSQDEPISEALRARIRRSWQTDIVDRLWGGSALVTWMEGVSKSRSWLIKVQSAQDGNEGHKTKELSGRCRAFHLEWSSGEDPTKRSDWKFSLRGMPKVALVLDGDWDRTKKKNLYEAGWDWVGDVSQLEELRTLVIGK
jgi:hypothetical protein